MRVAGYPYLRADRFAVRPSEDPHARVERMAALDAQARELELKNLGVAAAESVELLRCQHVLASAALARAPEAAAAARVPDDYSPALRTVGLYPLTQIPFSAGIVDWQDGVRAQFARPWAEVAAEGKRVRYEPQAVQGAPDPEHIAGVLPGAKAPKPDGRQAWRLLQRHAPVLLVDRMSGDDDLGALVWRTTAEGARIGVDTNDAVVYGRIALTEFGGRTRVQIVYTFWFPARTAESAFDILAGPLDGLIWRVTLDEDEQALVYDSIHPCGCFHMFFPTERVQARAHVAGEGPFDERLLAPQTVATPGADQRIVIALSARTHQLQRVLIEPRGAVSNSPVRAYRLLDEDGLRALPRAEGAGSRSAYGPDGFIAGSERAERWLFWPMGIASAGQMRQWGHHATAFVGRRHFDDPDLIERYFLPVGRP